MSLDHFEERADSWLLLVAGWEVSRYSTRPELEIEIVPTKDEDRRQRFELSGRALAEVRIRDFIGARVEEAIIWKDGRLAISFERGTSLVAGPDPNVEAWQIVGPEGLLVVCPAGGGEWLIWFGGGDDPSFEFVT
jgi:hypothetical protein